MWAFKPSDILLTMFLLIAGLTKAQQYPTITNFKGTPQTNGTVYIEFTATASTFSVGGYDLQRSADSAWNFVSVYTYSGSIGGPSSQDYNYYDYPPDPTKKYYYKVVFPNGYQSAVIMVDLGTLFGSYKIFEHPIYRDGISYLVFPYTPGTSWIMDIADPRGFLLYRFGGIAGNTIPLNASWFNGSGMYYFRLYPQDGSTVIKGKFEIQKGF